MNLLGQDPQEVADLERAFIVQTGHAGAALTRACAELLALLAEITRLQAMLSLGYKRGSQPPPER